MVLSQKDARRAYIDLLNTIEASVPVKLSHSSPGEKISEELSSLSVALAEIRGAALADGDIIIAKKAADLQFLVDFMIMHGSQDLIAELDNSEELAMAEATLVEVSGQLKKVKDRTAKTAKRLQSASAILQQVETLIGWAKKQ